MGIRACAEEGAEVGGPGPGLLPMGRACTRGHSRSAIVPEHTLLAVTAFAGVTAIFKD